MSTQGDCDKFQQQTKFPLPNVVIMECNNLMYHCNSSLHFWFGIEQWARLKRYELRWYQKTFDDDEILLAQPQDDYDFDFGIDNG